jgi:hypothetical protein
LEDAKLLVATVDEVLTALPHSGASTLCSRHCRPRFLEKHCAWPVAEKFRLPSSTFAVADGLADGLANGLGELIAS